MASKSTRGAGRNKRSSGIWERRKWWFVGAAAVGAIALLAVLTPMLSGPDIPEIAGQEFRTSETAPDMTLVTLDGEFRLSENRGKVLLLYFSFPG